MAEVETPPIEPDKAPTVDLSQVDSEFDQLVKWADGVTDSKDFLEGHLKEAQTVQAGAQILASRVNANRLVSLMRALTETDIVLIDRVAGMEIDELLIARKGLEESIEKTSIRIHNPTGIRTISGGGGGGVNIINQQSSLSPQLSAQKVPLNQESRMKVRQLVAKTKNHLQHEGECIDVETVEPKPAPAPAPAPDPKPTPEGTNAS